MKTKAFYSAITIVAVLAVIMGVNAYSGLAPAQVCEDGATCNFNEGNGGDELGAVAGPYYYGDFTVGGQLGYRAKIYEIDQTGATSSVTLSINDSGATVMMTGSSTQITLPAVSQTGATFRFQISGASTGYNWIIYSAEGDNINGTLSVNNADVACSGEDQLNFVVDGETIGDFVELISDGSQWLITGSDVETAAKLTCTDPA